MTHAQSKISSRTYTIVIIILAIAMLGAAGVAITYNTDWNRVFTPEVVDILFRAGLVLLGLVAFIGLMTLHIYLNQDNYVDYDDDPWL